MLVSYLIINIIHDNFD